MNLEGKQDHSLAYVKDENGVRQRRERRPPEGR